MSTLLDSYNTYFRDFQPILRDMSLRGIPIGNYEREALKRLIEADDVKVTEEIQKLVPEEVLSTKQKNGLKRTPKDLTGLVEIEVTISKEEKCSCLKKNRATCPVCIGTGTVPVGSVLKRWALPMAFNPNSKLQVIKFMKYLKHPVPKSLKKVDAEGNAADTTEVKELERLYAKTKHPIYPLLVEKRQLSKMMGTYVEGWQPDRDGRIRSTYGFGTATWQLNSKKPNVQNSPKRGRTTEQMARVEAFNRMLKAEPGHILINLDYKAFHAQTTACEAGLPDYLRLARIDIHSFVSCHLKKLPERHDLLKWSDTDLSAFFSKLKKDKVTKYDGALFGDVRSKAKAASLGIGFGMGPRKLYMQYKEDFASTKEAEGVWNLIMQDLFPGLLKWQNEVKREAAETGRLISRFGAIRQFHDVEHWDRKSQKMVGGDQAEAAIAFKPAANAFGMIRWAMLKLREKGLDERYNLINTIHDSLTLHPLKGEAGEAIAAYIPIMEANCPMMIYPGVTSAEGLSVEVDSGMGDSMAECK